MFFQLKILNLNQKFFRPRAVAANNYLILENFNYNLATVEIESSPHAIDVQYLKLNQFYALGLRFQIKGAVRILRNSPML